MKISDCHTNSPLKTPPEASNQIKVETSLGTMTIYQPSPEEVDRTTSLAKTIFTEAVLQTYVKFHHQSGSSEPIETWLQLKEGVSLKSHVQQVFDQEYKEYSENKKNLIYLSNSQGNLVGWLSHTPISEEGECYLSQCSLDATCQNHRIATAAFEKAFKEKQITQLFPHLKEVKLITRKINDFASQLYTRAGFIKDESIDPSIYGNSYDNRYVGFRLNL